ncbi:GNAT family N-acetyltransferase [Benzoatithermus flavus]|uniref:GNAT family N-acetyltransferase n=1 Tax=Benzoatithermus flavus TaxID=3108223 RepID=A0ABU8XQ40_9PROT
MTDVELVPVGPAEETVLLELARAFHATSGAPLDERGAAAVAMIARGHPLARAWLIRDGAGPVVGYAVLGLGFGIEYGGPDAFVDELYLVPAARGRGIGSAVMTRLEEEARALGLKALFLVVDPENVPARTVYDRRGFAATDWQLMAKRL